MNADTTPRIDPRLARRLEEKKAELDGYRPLAPSVVAYINDELRLLLTYHSNAIEGNTLSLRETQLVIEHGITVGGHSMREHLEATNHAEAFAYLTELVSKHAPITRDVVLRLHALVVDRILDSAGQFRAGPVTIRGVALQPPRASEVPKLMREWVAWLGGEGQRYPLVLRAAIAHHGFEAVRPFLDGNGRTGRLLLNLILMQHGYPPALLLQEWRLAYLEALSAANRGRYSPLANLVGRAVEQGLDLYLDACARVPIGEADEEQPLSELAQSFGYDPEYLGLLVRKGRIAATKRGARWYSTRAAIERYQRDVETGAIRPGRPRKAQ